MNAKCIMKSDNYKIFIIVKYQSIYKSLFKIMPVMRAFIESLTELVCIHSFTLG